MRMLAARAAVELVHVQELRGSDDKVIARVEPVKNLCLANKAYLVPEWEKIVGVLP